MHRTKVADMYVGASNKKCRRKVHALSCREKVRTWEILWLVNGIKSDIFDPMVLVRGFASKVLNPGIGSLVLDLYGFGPWFE